MAEKFKLMVDVDTGVDDAQALMQALASDNADILAVTCVAGNVGVDQVVTNTLRVLQAFDRYDIPVYRGAETSLLGSTQDSTFHHGGDGLGGQSDSEPPKTNQLQEGHAVTAMIELAKRYPGEVTLVALAPLTNVALAIRMDHKFTSRLKNVVIMGGNIRGVGNTTLSAEFNFGTDCEAASITLNEVRCPTSIISLELCRDTPLDMDWMEKLMKVDTKRGCFHRRINEYTQTRRKKHNPTKFISCDPVAMAVALDRSAILESQRCRCLVELQGERTRGQMVVDWEDRLKEEPKVEVVLKVDTEKLKLLYEKIFE